MTNNTTSLRFLFTIVLLLPLFSFAEDYIWPTEASRQLSSSFAESRGSRFHAGIDIKTQGITGFPIVAIRDGFVSRISISPYGYGRGLYFTLDTGETVVYGHLDRFNDEIQAYVKSEQQRRQSYKVQLYPSSTQFVYQQGDTLGYTGDSGVGYPHLHFELRDAYSNPINPLSKGYKVVDNVAPHISKVLIQPLDALSMVDDDFQPRVLWTRSTGLRRYVIDRPVKVYGRIAIGVSAYDQMDGVHNKFGIYKGELFIDGQSVFSAVYDKFSYSVNNHFKLDRDYRQMVLGRGYFYNLFVDEQNRLPFYGGAPTFSGVLNFKDHSVLDRTDDNVLEIVNIPESVTTLNGSSHSFEIVLQDYWGNTSRVRGTLTSENPYLVLNGSEASILDSIYNASTFGWDFKPSGDSTAPHFELKAKYFDRYVRLSLASQQPVQGEPVLTGWLCSGKKQSIPFVRKSSHSFVGAWPLNACDVGPIPLTIHAVTQDGDSLVQNEWLKFTTVQRGRVNKVFSDDSLCQLSFGTNSLFKTLFVRIDTMPGVQPGYDVIGKMYKIDPVDVPLDKGVSIALTYPPEDSLPGKLGVYQKSGARMRYVGSQISYTTNQVKAHLSGLGTFALVRDVDPPQIMALSPANNSRTRDRQPRLRAVFKDNLSGIAGEKQRVLKLDGERMIAEYDPEKLTLIYYPDEPLDVGKHTVELIVSDKNGNTASRLNTFYID